MNFPEFSRSSGKSQVRGLRDFPESIPEDDLVKIIFRKLFQDQQASDLQLSGIPEN